MNETERAAVEAEVQVAFEAYEAALGSNDIPALTGFFWEDTRTVRIGPEGGRYGHADISAFRKARDVSDIDRILYETRILVLSADIAVATTEYRRTGSGRRGAQSQIWLRCPEGWRIATAHVSLEA